jgi:hypothetical protein
LLKVSNFRREKSTDVVLSDSRAQFKAKLALSFIEIALSVLLNNNLILSKSLCGLKDAGELQSLYNIVSEGDE